MSIIKEDGEEIVFMPNNKENEVSIFPTDFICKEKENGIFGVNVPFFYKKMIEFNGSYIADYESDKLTIETNMCNIDVNIAKVIVGIFEELTNNSHKYNEYLADKYGKEIDVVETIGKSKRITIPISDMCRYLCKTYNKDNKKEIVKKLKKIADGIINYRAKINGKYIYSTFNPLCTGVIINTKENTFSILVSDFLIYNSLNSYVKIQIAKNFMNAKSLGLFNVAMYMVSFRYNDRHRIKYKQYNKISVKTILNKYYINKDIEEELEKDKKMRKSEFVKKLNRIIKKSLNLYDKKAKYELNIEGYDTVSMILERGTVSIDLPVFEERLEYNIQQIKKVKKYNKDGDTKELNSSDANNVNSEELPFDFS